MNSPLSKNRADLTVNRQAALAKDANDAAAICEAVTRPSMRFVPTKSEQQQSGLTPYRSRQLLVRQRTMLSNAIRGHWPSSALSRRKDAMERPSCSRS